MAKGNVPILENELLIMHSKHLLQLQLIVLVIRNGGAQTKETNHGSCVCLPFKNIMEKKTINAIFNGDNGLKHVRMRPKNSKPGSLPKCADDPRKPVSLGTMLKNSTKCESGIISHDDVVQNL